MIRDNVRAFVRAELVPRVGDWYERGVLPRELGSLGVLGMHLDGYGCAGANAVSYGLKCLELEAGDSGLRSFVSVQGMADLESGVAYEGTADVHTLVLGAAVTGWPAYR